MPLFEIGKDEVIPFRRVQAGPELYEKAIEDLLWPNLEAFIGKPLFPVARQPQLGTSLVPDIVALDTEGRVFVIEVKRDIDRRQLAQCLEYAGWARTTNLDELARLFHGGADAFFAAWMEFTDTPSPRLIRRPPQLVLVARDLDQRTDSALAFLTESKLTVTVLRVTLYEDQAHRRFIDVAADHEPIFAEVPHPALPVVVVEDEHQAERTEGRSRPTRFEIEGRRVEISDLLEAGLLRIGEQLTWSRPRIGQIYNATITEAGLIELEDGRVFSSPSRAAMEAAEVPAYDGWHAWKVSTGERIGDLRDRLLISGREHLDDDPTLEHTHEGRGVAVDAASA